MRQKRYVKRCVFCRKTTGGLFAIPVDYPVELGARYQVKCLECGGLGPLAKTIELAHKNYLKFNMECIV